MKPVDAVKLDNVIARPSIPYKRPIWHNEPQLPLDVTVRYLLAPGELESGERRRATGAQSCMTLKKIYLLTRTTRTVLFREWPKTCVCQRS